METQFYCRRVLQSVIDHVVAGGGRHLQPPSTTLDPSRSDSASIDPCSQLSRDEFGFFIEDGVASGGTPSTSRDKIRLDNSRLVKWTQMIANDMKEFYRNPRTVRRRVRKGIPDPIRGFVWRKLTGSEDAQALAPKGYYHQTLAMGTSPWEAQIERDIHRTFPKHILFRDQSGIGQHALFNVLKVYSIYDNELGYCQGMGFIAGMFLMHMGEEDTFWMLVQILTGGGYAMRTLFISGMPLTFLRVFQLKKLVERRMPRLWAHFQQENADLMTLTMQWFITNYCYNLPFRVLLRIWDIYLYEKSPKIIFRVALYFFARLQDQLLRVDFEGIMTSMKEFYGTLLADDVIDHALKVRLTTKELQLLEKDYAKSSR